MKRRRQYEQNRYWDPKTGVRNRRLERSARERGEQFKAKPVQLKLADVAEGRVRAAEKEMAPSLNYLY